jgi:phenylacetate-coenzyme A ligase PaaK-like adenylate-forming protein
MEVLAEREQWSRSEIADFQLQKINQIWDYAITHVPYYRRLLRDRNLPRQFQTLGEYASSVPVLDKATVRSAQVLSDTPRPGNWYFTGGSTGIPLAVYQETEATNEMAWCQYRARVLWNVGLFEKRALLWGHPTQITPGSGHKLRQLFTDLMLNRIRFSVYNLGKADLLRYLSRMREFKPVQLYGYSIATYLLALEALRGNIEVDSLRLVTLTAERATETIRQTIEQAFETNVTEEYGARECLLIAYEDRQHLLRIREDNVMVETLPLGDGCYRIIISVLSNPSFPLLRYDIGDLTEKPLTETNVGFSLLAPVTGKANDYLIGASGRRIYAGVLHGLYHYPIRRFIAHQFSDGKVLMLMEPNGPATNMDIGSMERKLRALLDGQEVEVRLTESIPQTSLNKHRWIISEITNAQPRQSVHSSPMM